MTTVYTVSTDPSAYGSDCTPKQARLIALALASMICAEFSDRELEVEIKNDAGDRYRAPEPDSLEDEIGRWIETSEAMPKACRDGLRVASEYFADDELRGLTLAEIEELDLNWLAYYPVVDPETGTCVRVAHIEEPDLIFCEGFAVIVQEVRDVDNDGEPCAGTEEKATFCAWIGRGVVVDTNNEQHWTDANNLADTWDRWDNHEDSWSN